MFRAVRADDVSRRVEGSDASVLGGVVSSEVRMTPSPFGPPMALFEMDARRFWREGDPKGVRVSGRVRVYGVPASRALVYGDEIALKGRLELPLGKRNPGGFDARAFLERRGVRSVFYAEKNSSLKILRRGRGNLILAVSLTAKKFLSDAVGRHFEGRDAALLRALFLGERGDFDGEFLDAFVKTGTLHILSVSGFNVGFLVFTVFLLLKPLPRDARIAAAFAAVWGYCLIVGWQAPVVRASIMASVFLLGSLLGRKADGLNALGLAALAILAVRPYELFDTGFRLSFAAVFALVALMPRFCPPPRLFPGETPTFKERIFRYVRELWWVSFVCLFAVMPFTVQAFYAVTPYAPLANLAVVPTAFLLFFSGALFFLFFAWLPPSLALLPALMKPLMSALAACLFFLERLPGAYVVTGALHPVLCAALVAGLALLFAWPVASPRLRALAIALFVANVFLVQDIVRHAPRVFSVTVLDVGQGDAIYVEFPWGGNLLVDAGSERAGDRGRRVVVPFLHERGVRALDAAVISHPQEDHAGGFEAVFDAVRVNAVLETGRPYATWLYRRFSQRISEEGSRRLIVTRGARVVGFRDVSVEVLHPSAEFHKDVNDDSAVLRVSSAGASVLLTGDIGEAAMRELIASPDALRADVLKVPHHGAKMGEAGARFVVAVSPQASVVSAGERNPFGHPRPETLSVLRRAGPVYRTDRHGAVTLAAEGEGFRVLTADF